MPAVSPVPPSPAADAELIAACRRGERGAWEHLVLRFERLIFTVPRRAGLGDDAAADVFQTVFMRLYEHLDTLEQPDRVQAWLVTTARRETLRLLQQQRRTQPLAPAGADGDDDERGPELEAVDPDPLPEALLDELQQRHRARRAFAALAEPCHTMLELLYWRDEPLPYAEIAARLGVPIGSIGPTRARCLAKLRDSMDRSQ
jgi:RNA polymerase sigma factor (sigma-70 family)